MQKQSQNIQYVLARLTTSYKLISCIRLNLSLLKSYFDINRHDYNILKKHILTNGHLISVTAELLEEKRWQEVMSTIKYTCGIIDSTRLKAKWTDYLSNYEISDHIPVSPINESIKFLEFILKAGNLSDLESDVIEYELKRNLTLLYNFNDPYISVTNDITSIKNPTSYKISINPSLIVLSPKNIETQSYILTKILKKDFPTPESFICFYKNKSTLKTNKILLSKKTYAKLTDMASCENLTVFYNNANATENNELLINAFKNNLIFIHEVVSYD